MQSSDKKAAGAAKLGLTRRALLRDGALSLGALGVLGAIGVRRSRAADVAAQSAPFVMIENFFRVRAEPGRGAPREGPQDRRGVAETVVGGVVRRDPAGGYRAGVQHAEPARGWALSLYLL